MAADKPAVLPPWDGRDRCAEVTLVFAALIVPLFTGLCLMLIFLVRELPADDTMFTVAITGVTGLKDDDIIDLPTTSAAAAAALLSPVFNLTFRIDNTGNPDYDACVPGLSRADVSYGGAFLAGGSVPPLCAGKSRSDRVAARASAENVAVPQFLMDQLAAGDAPCFK